MSYIVQMVLQLWIGFETSSFILSTDFQTPFRQRHFLECPPYQPLPHLNAVVPKLFLMGPPLVNKEIFTLGTTALINAIHLCLIVFPCLLDCLDFSHLIFVPCVKHSSLHTNLVFKWIFHPACILDLILPLPWKTTLSFDFCVLTLDHNKGLLIFPLCWVLHLSSLHLYHEEPKPRPSTSGLLLSKKWLESMER